MRKTFTLAAAAAMFMSLPLAAQAFPIAASPAVDSTPGVTLVAGGCGPAFHRGPLGGCRVNRAFVRRPVVVVRRPIVRRPVVVVRRPVVRRPFVVVRRPACRIVGLIPHRVCRY